METGMNTLALLEKKLRGLDEPLTHPILKWLYSHLPPRRIRSKRLHGHYGAVISILLEFLESGPLTVDEKRIVEDYLEAVVPFVEQFEKEKYTQTGAGPEEIMRFLMEQH